MEIIIAKHSGFCSGVKKAVELVEKNISSDVVTLGPVVHNQSVTEYFKNKGVDYIDNHRGINNKRVIIRSHGVTPEIITQLKANNNTVIDGTCPFVSRVQKLAEEVVTTGKQLIILGDESHPEIIGVKGWAKDNAIIINKLEDLKTIKLDPTKGISVVAQTTFDNENFSKIITELKSIIPKTEALELEIHNTICKATRDRQSAVREMAQKVDTVLVIGGKKSSNTAKLTSICKEIGVVTYQIEEAKQIDLNWLKNTKKIGIAAGASTPDWIIREVTSMVNEVTEKQNEVTESEVTENEVTETEVTQTQATETEVTEESNGSEQEQTWETIQAAFDNKTTLTGKAVEVVKGGILIDLGIRAFMPASLVDTKFVEDLNEFVGQELTFLVKEIDKEKNKVILSRKDLLLEEKQGAQKDIFANLKEGTRVKGIVRRMTDFGAFVDIGGIDGLVHVSNLSWSRVKHPSDILEVGQEIEVDILKLDEEKQKISLSYKTTQKSPFESNIKNFKEGSIVEGKVVRLADFGAFVELAPQIDGLVHISQISDDHISKTSEVLAVGQTVNVKILEIDTKTKRISLSIKEAKPKEDFSKYAGDSDSLNVTLGDSFPDLSELFKKKD